MSIYVERLIKAPIDQIWSATQDPELHAGWDLRFTSIQYLPKATPDEPQRFRYATRLGFGVGVHGDGETIGERNGADGSRTSALQFWSDQRRSLIREGRGYWKYVPTPEGVLFLTSYDYTTRGGRLGSLIDRMAFRRLMGWATAWSFDRLALWLERGVDPASAGRQSLIHGIARCTLAAVFAYHGIVPKLLGPATEEVRLLEASNIPADVVGPLLAIIGVLEVAFAILLLAAWHSRWPPLATAIFAIATTLAIVLVEPGLVTTAFGPVTLNASILALAAIDVTLLPDLPDAGRCRRGPAAAVSP